MKNIVQKVTTAGALIKDEMILILRRSLNDDVYPGLWELPSGKKEPLESVWDSVVREVKEETGIDVTALDVVSTFNFEVDKPDEIRDVTQIVFLVEPTVSISVTISNEHDEFKWIKKDEMKNYNLSKETQTAIEKAFLYLTTYKNN